MSCLTSSDHKRDFDMSAVQLGLLSGLRVADITGVFGAYASRLISDHGATVVRIVPEAGDPAEGIGPFHEKTGESYFARFVNANKKSVAISASQLKDPKFFASILEWADVVIEELPALGGLSEMQVAATLKKSGHDTVIVSIRPYAEGSKFEGKPIDDLTAQAVGALMSLSGSPDREPLALNGGQAHYIVGVFAATAALLGLNDTGGPSGKRHYTVTVQEAIVHSLETAVQYYTTEGVVRGRKGSAQQAGDGSYHAKDGRVVMGAMTDFEWGRLCTWIGKHGIKDAGEFATWKLEQRRDPVNVKRFANSFEGFAREHTCEYLTTAGQANRVLISPSYTLTQILKDSQLTYDQFFRPVSDSTGRHWMFPGAPYQISSGSVFVREAARKFGEDTEWFRRVALKKPKIAPRSEKK